jgi:hypothetical protein
MKNLIFALGNANLTESVVITISTDIELWIDSKINRSEQKMKIESISPIQKENDSIRMELRILTDTVKNGSKMGGKV